MGKIVYLDKDLKSEPCDNNATLPFKELIDGLIKNSERKFPEDRQHVKTFKPYWGTDDFVRKDQCSNWMDLGFFSTVYECYNKHWALKTVPDDWWCTIIKTVAIAIDNNSKKERVREFFVEHEGKKKLEVLISGDLDFDKFFRDMTNLIQDNVKVEGFVDAIRSDFSTSTPTHKIVSEIMVMTSMQEFFEYVMCLSCGIPYIEFMGAEDDWKNLKVKLLKLKKMLDPIHQEIGLQGWWEDVAGVLDKILDSVKGNVDKEWWSNIIRVTPGARFGSGGQRHMLYDGWFITKLLNNQNGINNLNKIPSGLASVSLTINELGLISYAAIVSGIGGMKVDTSNATPLAEAVHGWAIFR